MMDNREVCVLLNICYVPLSMEIVTKIAEEAQNRIFGGCE
jgi:hypothetical protein